MTEPKDKLIGKQLAVIEDIVDGEMAETEVLAAHSVLRDDYRQWLEQTDFAALLQFQLDTTRRSAILLIAAYAPKAVERLLFLAEKGTGDTARRACLDILAMPQTLADAGSAAPGKATIEPPIDTPTAAKILEVIANAKRKTK